MIHAVEFIPEIEEPKEPCKSDVKTVDELLALPWVVARKRGEWRYSPPPRIHWEKREDFYSTHGLLATLDENERPWMVARLTFDSLEECRAFKL